MCVRIWNNAVTVFSEYLKSFLITSSYDNPTHSAMATGICKSFDYKIPRIFLKIKINLNLHLLPWINYQNTFP